MANPNYLSLLRHTTSEATEYQYQIELSGYQLKLLNYAMMFQEERDVGIIQMDTSKQWKLLRKSVTDQIDAQGIEKAPKRADGFGGHRDVVTSIRQESENSENDADGGGTAVAATAGGD